METLLKYFPGVILIFITSCCQPRKDQFNRELQSISLARGEIALCASGVAQFGQVEFRLACREKARSDFNLATALPHSFKYTEAEKVFAKVLDEDPDCVMAYWGGAMSNFHPLWAPPTKEELEKGSRIIKLARSLENKSTRESDYLEAVASLYDEWDTLDT